MPRSENEIDFNDLHCLEGLSVVREQLLAVLCANDAESEAPPDPPEIARPDIDKMLGRYSFTLPNAKIWDAHDLQFLRKTAFSSFVGAELYKEWEAHPKRRTILEADVAPMAKAKRQKGRGDLVEALERYVYLSVSNTAWDLHSRELVAMSDLRYHIADCFDDWLRHEKRKEIPKVNLVFDPTQQKGEGYINRFKGLPLSPGKQFAECAHIIKLLRVLCNNDAEVFNWVLRWLAYPLQNVGAKMATAVLMHSSVHGSGKSLFFDGVMGRIYGDYSKTYGQSQLESQYNDWISETLFGCFEEVLSRNQKFSHTGTLKQMITGEKFYVEKKFLSGWTESNHMNCVFLSNEVQPLPIEPSDRRFCVVWPEETLIEPMQAAVSYELLNGGVEAFYGYLLSVDLTGFDPHTKPPMTEAKERLIDFGRPSWEVFFHEWENGDLDVPFIPIRLDQLFSVYLSWCTKGKEHAVGRNRFSGFIVSKIPRRRNVLYDNGKCKGKGTIFFPVNCPSDVAQGKWIADSVAEIALKLQKAAEHE